MNDDSRSGIVIVDKPPGPTSHDMVSRVRHALGLRRVGHAGTLDPFASGVLIVLVGRATRLARYFVELPKTYETVVALGAVSSTGDPEGEVRVTGVVPERLELPVGVVRQRPPAHSAVKIAGERAYARARRGEEVQTAEREVTVHEASLLWHEGDRAGMRFVCSSGTYVRSLVAGLGDAYCLSLRRLAVGPFTPAGAWPGEGVPDPLAVEDAWGRFAPVQALTEEDVRAARHGRPLAPCGARGPVLLVDGEGVAVAVASERDGRLRVEVGLRG